MCVCVWRWWWVGGGGGGEDIQVGSRKGGLINTQKDQELASRITGNISPERWLMIVPSHHISFSGLYVPSE